MAQLRSFSRAVLFAGTPEQCRSTVEQAEQYRDKLEERGVLLVPLPIYAADGGEGGDAEVPALEADDLRCGFCKGFCACETACFAALRPPSATTDRTGMRTSHV